MRRHHHAFPRRLIRHHPLLHVLRRDDSLHHRQGDGADVHLVFEGVGDAQEFEAEAIEAEALLRALDNRWTAKLEVPAEGVSSTVTEEDLKMNLDPKPARK